MLDNAGNADPDCGYDQADIDRCEAILDGFTAALAAPLAPDDVRSKIKIIVIELNELNAASDDCLIETDQREGLCAFIITAAGHAGLPCDDDPTEEWREW